MTDHIFWQAEKLRNEILHLNELLKNGHLEVTAPCIKDFKPYGLTFEKCPDIKAAFEAKRDALQKEYEAL